MASDYAVSESDGCALFFSGAVRKWETMEANGTFDA